MSKLMEQKVYKKIPGCLSILCWPSTAQHGASLKYGSYTKWDPLENRQNLCETACGEGCELVSVTFSVEHCKAEPVQALGT